MADDVAPFRPKLGAIVPPIGAELLAHYYIARRSRLARLALEPLELRYLAAMRWRLVRLVPFVLAPAYAPLWRSADRAVRQIMLDAIFQSGDFHYGAAGREIRQILARWLHARLEPIERPERAARPTANPEAGALM